MRPNALAKRRPAPPRPTDWDKSPNVDLNFIRDRLKWLAEGGMGGASVTLQFDARGVLMKVEYRTYENGPDS